MLDPVPPLYASTLVIITGVINVTVCDTEELESNEMLFVVNKFHGPDKNHFPLPQSATPVGYCPLRVVFGFDKVSNVITEDCANNGKREARAKNSVPRKRLMKKEKRHLYFLNIRQSKVH